MKNGWTALHYASQNGSVSAVSVLIEGGATVNIQTKVYYYSSILLSMHGNRLQANFM